MEKAKGKKLFYRPAGKRKGMYTPTQIICVSFVIVIALGTFLLSLPVASKHGRLDVLDAMFTATSATCVTGLIVRDTWTQFTYFGQAVILLLIQVGGLGLVTLTSFFALAMRRRMGFRDLRLLGESVSADGYAQAKDVLKIVVGLAGLFEGIGIVLLLFAFVPQFGLEGIWVSVFTAISAFCNAGFDLLTATPGAVGLSEYTNNPLVMITLIVLITTGGLGFIVWRNIRHYSKAKRLLLHTKLVLIMAAVMLLVGAAIIFIVEFSNQDTLGQMPIGEKILTSIFLSASSRTAGFPCFDMNDLMPFTKIIITILMFIGAAPASTAGGIKITTVALVVCTVISVLKGREDTYLMGHRIKRDAIYKTFTVIVLSLTLIAVSFTGILMCCEGMSLQKTIFEVVSAFSTTGFSVGASAEMNVPAKLIMIFTMLAGRIGPVTLMTSLIIRKNHNSDKNRILPEGNILVG